MLSQTRCPYYRCYSRRRTPGLSCGQRRERSGRFWPSAPGPCWAPLRPRAPAWVGLTGPKVSRRHATAVHPPRPASCPHQRPAWQSAWRCHASPDAHPPPTAGIRRPPLHHDGDVDHPTHHRTRPRPLRLRVTLRGPHWTGHRPRVRPAPPQACPRLPPAGLGGQRPVPAPPQGRGEPRPRHGTAQACTRDRRSSGQPTGLPHPRHACGTPAGDTSRRPGRRQHRRARQRVRRSHVEGGWPPAQEPLPSACLRPGVCRWGAEAHGTPARRAPASGSALPCQPRHEDAGACPAHRQGTATAVPCFSPAPPRPPRGAQRQA
jgi:hypothetical protein